MRSWTHNLHIRCASAASDSSCNVKWWQQHLSFHILTTSQASHGLSLGILHSPKSSPTCATLWLSLRHQLPTLWGQACFSVPLGNNPPIACSLAMSSFRKHCTFQEEGSSFQVEKMKARNWMFIQTSCSVQVFEGRKAKEGRVDWEKHHWLAGGYRLLHYHNEVSEDLCSPQLLSPRCAPPWPMWWALLW